MKGAPEAPHSKYLHVYAIVRFDLGVSDPRQGATVVKVLSSVELVHQEATRLNELNQDKKCEYIVQTTRFVRTLKGLTAES
jgi:hypothetical protein